LLGSAKATSASTELTSAAARRAGAGGRIFSFGKNALLVYSKLALYTSLSLQWRLKLAFTFRMRDCSNWPA
jgi:hypothetical protein